MEENIIYMLFEQKVENENFEDEEVTTLKNEQKIKMDKLSDFIDDNIEIGIRKKLKDLIEDYSNSVFDCFYCKNRLYYKEGFSDCTKLIYKSLKN